MQYDTYNYSIANEKNISLIIKLHFSDTPLLGNMHVFFAQFCPSKPNPHFLCLNNNDSSVSDSDFLWFLLLRFLFCTCCAAWRQCTSLLIVSGESSQTTRHPRSFQWKKKEMSTTVQRRTDLEKGMLWQIPFSWAYASWRGIWYCLSLCFQKPYQQTDLIERYHKENSHG